MRIMVVDRSATMRSMLSLALGRLPGAEVVSAAGLEDMAFATGEFFDLIVVDRDVRDGSDLQWLTQVRALTSPQGVILVIGHRVSGPEAVRMREAGIAGFLLKPIDPGQLRDRALDLVGRQRTGVDTVAGEDPDETEPLAEAA